MDMDIVWQQYELDGLEQGLGRLFPTAAFSLRELLDAIWSGNILGAGRLLAAGVASDLGAGFAGVKNTFIWLLVLGILSALMSHFVEVFDRNQVADLSFYLFYLLTTSILLKGFYQSAGIASEAIENIVLFNRLLVPTYMIAVGAATGLTTVNAYSQLLWLLLYVVEEFLFKWVLPLIYAYCLLAVLSGIWKEDKLTLLMELVAKLIGWVLKGAIGFVTGVSVFQSVITPLIDSAKTTAIQKILSAIPGAGNLADGILELLAGSAVLIKNSLGVVLLLLLLTLCALPLLQIFVTALLFKGAAAVLGIVADKRLPFCVDQVGEAGMLLFRVTGCIMLLFLIALAAVAACAGGTGVY